MSKEVSFIAIAVVALAAVAILMFHPAPAKSSLPVTATFAGVSLRIELATTTDTQEKGLGGRENVLDDYGMLFVFDKSARYGFWMKDMLVPIDIFWLGEDRRVVSFISNVATSTYPNVFYPPSPATYVLETRAGFASAHRIATGTPLLLQNR